MVLPSHTASSLGLEVSWNLSRAGNWRGKLRDIGGTRQPHRTDARGTGRGAARRLVNVPSSMLIHRD